MSNLENSITPRIKIIVEVASNHCGDISIAKKFIKIASEVGADYVKFQSYCYKDLANKDDFQKDWIKKTEFSDKDHFALIEECKKQKIRFLTTCFSIKRTDFLSSLGLDEIKVASPDLLSFAMIEKLSHHFKHLIISTGMHSTGEIRKAIQFLLKNKINATLLHAVSIYPVPIEKTFMHKFLWLKDNFPKVGYSNHTPNTKALCFAMAHGASIVEAHMKLGQDGPGRATSWDLLPEDFKKMVDYKHILEKMLGEKDWIKGEDYLFSEEIEARKKFIGRWGDNKEEQ